MDTHPTFANGKICYIEIPATDIQASASFYEAVLGWHIHTRDDGSVAFDDSVTEVSGTWVTGRTPSTKIGMLVHIMPVGMELPEITARFSDPFGNIFGLYQQPS